jgi:hypothetical protein
MGKNTYARKYQITINNPSDKGYNHETIGTNLRQLKPLIYYCLSDEEAKTPHTHIYAVFNSVVRFSTIKQRFPEAHIESARGTHAENRAYIEKSGIWENDTKHGTKIAGTFEEWGELPPERQAALGGHEELLADIKDGLSTSDIIEKNPTLILQTDRIERARLTLTRPPAWRDMAVEYWFGATGTGKTRTVMNAHDTNDIYRVADYKNPFDGYAGQSVLVLDEYRSNLNMPLLLNVLDGYPLDLPARYSNKVAMYSRVYIISNMDLRKQYPYEQFRAIETWEAFLRRVPTITYFCGDCRKKYITADWLLYGENARPMNITQTCGSIPASNLEIASDVE